FTEELRSYVASVLGEMGYSMYWGSGGTGRRREGPVSLQVPREAAHAGCKSLPTPLQHPVTLQALPRLYGLNNLIVIDLIKVGENVDKILIKRGTKEKLEKSPPLSQGELFLAKHEERLSVGGPKGNISIPSMEDLEEVSSIVLS